jgi:SPP1 family predicted phage head-tail adaptor
MLDRLITLRWKGTEIVSNSEQPTFNSPTDINVYASKEDSNSGQKEGTIEMAVRAKSYTNFIIRYRSGVTTKVEVIENGVLYNIDSVVEIGRKMWLNLRCEQIGQK